MRGFVENRHSLSRAFHRARSVAGEVVGLSETEQRVAFADAVTDLPAERELLSEVFDGAFSVARDVPALGGRLPDKTPLTFGPHIFDGEAVAPIYQRFVLLDTLMQLRTLYPNASKVLCLPPPPYGPSVSTSTRTRTVEYKQYLGIYLGIIQRIYAKCDFKIIPFPFECLDESGIYTHIRFSLNPEIGDMHKNKEYGVLLWNEIGKHIL
jgi:hypothetical protein